MQKFAEASSVDIATVILAAFACLLARLSQQQAVAIACSIYDVATTALVNFDERTRVSDVFSKTTVKDVDPSSGAASPDIAYAYGRPGSLQAQSAAPLRLIVQPGLSNMSIKLESPGGLWSARTLGLWVTYLCTILNNIIAEPHLLIKNIPLLGRAETLRLYQHLNQTKKAFRFHLCVHDLFAEVAGRQPDAIALVCGSARVTYRELDSRSELLARFLVAQGASPDRPIAVCMDRSADLPMALLAVLRSGACYVPLDARVPGERIRRILAECQPIAVIADHTTADLPALSSFPLIRVDRPLQQGSSNRRSDVAVEPANLAYIVYTSGTTGTPKGVMIRHRSLVNVLCAMTLDLDLITSDRLLALATVSFDVATMDIFLPLTTGGTLVVADSLLAADPLRLAIVLDAEHITILEATPMTWRLLVESQWSGRPGMRIIVGGEALPRDLANKLTTLGSGLWNSYGPTETTICSGNLRVHIEDGIVPIGPPLPNVHYYVLSETGELLPPGIAGELYIGGEGLARGYFGNPELTAKRFLPNPFMSEPDQRIYQTGDAVRIVNDTELEFLGRLDRQVKLHGYRIELEEIETVLRSHFSISDAAVVIRHDVRMHPRLVAYIVQKGSSSNSDEVRAHVASTLPEYMIPGMFITIPTLPHTANGKVDYAKLPEPKAPEESPLQREEPRSLVEAKLIDTWETTLGMRGLSIYANFFDLGGSSLDAARLIANINRALHVDLPLASLYSAGTIDTMAEMIRSKQNPFESISLVPISPSGTLPPLFLVHGIDGNIINFHALAWLMGDDQPVYGIQAQSLAAGHPGLLTMEALASHYLAEIQAIQPSGPYYFLGYSFGGMVCLEMAQQLLARREEIGMLGMLDSWRPDYLLGTWMPKPLHSEVSDRAGNFMAFLASVPLKKTGHFDWREDRSLGVPVDLCFRGCLRKAVSTFVLETPPRNQFTGREKLSGAAVPRAHYSVQVWGEDRSTTPQ